MAMRPWYSFYDSIAFAPARFLLPTKREGPVATLPGTPGRWRLPDNLNDTQAYLKLQDDLQAQATLLLSYEFLQAAILACLVLRGLLETIPIPKLGVTVRSLRRATPDLLTFLVIALLCSFCYMVIATLAYGDRIERFSTLAGSLAFLWEFQFIAGWEDALYELFDGNVIRSPAQVRLPVYPGLNNFTLRSDCRFSLVVGFISFYANVKRRNTDTARTLSVSPQHPIPLDNVRRRCCCGCSLSPCPPSSC
jgi:hypothetical protein